MQRAYAFMERLAALVVLCTAVSISAPQLAVAADHPFLEGNPALCGTDWYSYGPGLVPLAALDIVSRCDKIDSASITGLGDDFASFLKETEQELGDSGRLPKGVLYHYTLTVTNDGGHNIDLNLSDWEVVNSPYVWMARSFSYSVPACSRMILAFYSPWAPIIENDVLVNVGLADPRVHKDGGGWSTVSAGMTTIVLPVQNQYFPDGFRFERISVKGARTEACRAEH